MEKHEIIYRSYKRYHKGDECLELEEKKINREKMIAEKKIKEVSTNLDKLLDYENIDDEDIEELDNSLYAEKRAKKNRKRHIERFNELKKNKEFR